MAASKRETRPTRSPSLPTMQAASWAMSRFRDTAKKLFETDRSCSELRLYFYAATMPGWAIMSSAVARWMKRRPERPVSAYLGTDHALTDPDLMDAMHNAGIHVYLVRHYRGIFHPKVVWLVQPSGGILLAGSNNFTEDGLSNNIEFATLTTLSEVDPTLEQWHRGVHLASDSYSPELVRSYRQEKEKFGRDRAKLGKARTFTWSRRTSGRTQTGQATSPAGVATGDLVLEVMPRETSTEGRQVQIPIPVVNTFFSLGPKIGTSKQVSVVNDQTGQDRVLTITRNKNHTSRLSIRELEYRSRPCVLRIRKQSTTRFSVTIVRQSIDPEGYATLIALCPQSPPSRRWTVVRKSDL